VHLPIACRNPKEKPDPRESLSAIGKPDQSRRLLPRPGRRFAAGRAPIGWPTSLHGFKAYLANGRTKRNRVRSPAERTMKALPSGTVLLVVAACLVLRLAAAAFTGLAADESYYRLWSFGLSPGYLDHPPMVAFMMAAGRFLAGDNELGLRLVGVFCAAIGALAIWRAALNLAGRPAADLAAIWYSVVPTIVVAGVIMTPDTGAILFWTLTLWALTERLASGNRSWWLVVGLMAGLGLQSKYTNFFLLAGIALFVLADRELRRDFLDWHIWAGGALALAIFAPNIIWNAANDWGNFDKQIGRGGRLGNYDPRYFPEFLGLMLLVFHPAVVVFAAIAFRQRCRGTVDANDAPAARYALLMPVLTSLPILAYFSWHAQFARIEGNWPSPLTAPMLLLAAPVATAAVSGHLARLRVGTTISAVALMLIIYGWTANPVALMPEKRDPSTQTRGWAQLGAALAATAQREGVSAIGATSYGTTGQLAFALRDTGLAVVQINERERYRFMAPPEAAMATRPALVIDLDRRLDEAALAARYGTVARLPDLVRAEQSRGGTYAVYRVEEPLLAH